MQKSSSKMLICSFVFSKCRKFIIPILPIPYKVTYSKTNSNLIPPLLLLRFYYFFWLYCLHNLCDIRYFIKNILPCGKVTWTYRDVKFFVWTSLRQTTLRWLLFNTSTLFKTFTCLPSSSNCIMALGWETRGCMGKLLNTANSFFYLFSY